MVHVLCEGYCERMRILIATIGSRGDNEPFRALALKAADAEHEVFFSHTTDIPSDPEAPYQDLLIRGSFETFINDQGVSVLKALRSYKSVMKPMLENAWQDVVEHIDLIVPDVVVYHPKLVTVPVAAHRVGAIAVIAEMFPTLTPTTEFAAAGAPSGMPGWLNKFSFSLINLGLKAMGSPAEKLAKERDVININPDLTVCPVSPTLVPKPHDWPHWAHVTGAWSVESDTELDRELDEFLSSGPVLYAGFGSMKDSRGAKRAEAIVKAAKATNLKVVLVTGWGGLVPTLEHVEDPDVLVRASVPHDLVFPRVDLIMHHGGAGTTHAAVASGCVSVIMPFIADQPWWAKRLHKLGLGPKPLSRKTTNPRKIAKVLLACSDYHVAVTEAARLMADEDGVAEAIELFDSVEHGFTDIRPT